MNRTVSMAGAAITTVTVFLFAVCILCDFIFGSYIVCMFLPIGYMMMAAGLHHECGEKTKVSANIGMILAGVYAVLILLVYFAQTTTVRTEILTDQGKKEDNPVLPAIHKGWYQTTYTIAKDVFAEEGDYSIALRSRETDGRPGRISGGTSGEDGDILTESETILWTGPVEFAIDKTPPSVVIGGLDQDSYLADRKEYTITALDNMRLKKVRLSVRKEEESRGKTILLTEKDFRENHSISSELSSYEGYQILAYDAWDYAGNKRSARDGSDEKRVLVSGSPLFHFYHRHRLGLAMWLLFIYIASIPGILLTRRYFFDIF